MIKFVIPPKFDSNMLKLKTLLFVLITFCAFSHAQEKQTSWFPYPAYSDRNAWEELLGSHADYLIAQGQKYLDYTWQSVNATAYLAYERTGDRQVMERPMSANRVALNALMLAELAEGKGRFMDQLINGTWHIAHMPSWVLSAHLHRQRTKRSLPDPEHQIIDLGSGSLGAQMSVAYHFFHETFDKVDPVISRVIKSAVKKQILDPYLDVTNYKPHWWLGFDLKPGTVVNNWNPWCNADVILCFLLIEEDQERLHKAVDQSFKSINKFIDYVKKDGACEEGPAYWGHAAGKLYDYLQIMDYAYEGQVPLLKEQLIKDMGEYISRSFVRDGWVVNFADATAKLSYSPSLIYNYGKAVSSVEMQDFAIYNLARESEGKYALPKPVMGNDIFRSLESLKYINEMSQRVNQLNADVASGYSLEQSIADLRRHVPSFTWYPETQFCYVKNESDWFFAAKGGHNNESHNHNDIGTFILYKGAVPVFVDAGVGTYTKKTFSKDRYTIWSMQSAWHNLPEINGISQKNGGEFKARNVEADGKGKVKSFKLDVAGAYNSAARCKSWTREYKVSDNLLTITDEYKLESRAAADVENFLVQGAVYQEGEVTSDGYVVKPKEVVVENKGVEFKIQYPAQMAVAVEVMELDDPKLTKVWGTSLKRISFTSSSTAPLTGKYVFKISEL